MVRILQVGGSLHFKATQTNIYTQWGRGGVVSGCERRESARCHQDLDRDNECIVREIGNSRCFVTNRQSHLIYTLF